MMRSAPLILAAVAALFTTGAAPAPPAQPVVVELFTSQGCSSCPPADVALAQVADRPDVIALSFGVTYWDNLGWRDTFARSEFTDRQKSYARRMGHAPYTPEVVAGGRTASVGNSRGRIEALIAKARAPAAAVVSADPASATVGPGVAPRGGADVWLVRYDPRIVRVPVKAGENTGKTLPVRNVVRALTRLGQWDGRAAQFRYPAAPPDSTAWSSCRPATAARSWPPGASDRRFARGLTPCCNLQGAELRLSRAQCGKPRFSA